MGDEKNAGWAAEHRTQVVVAVITVIGVVISALFANWDKIFRDRNYYNVSSAAPRNSPDEVPDVFPVTRGKDLIGGTMDSATDTTRPSAQELNLSNSIEKVSNRLVSFNEHEKSLSWDAQNCAIKYEYKNNSVAGSCGFEPGIQRARYLDSHPKRLTIDLGDQDSLGCQKYGGFSSNHRLYLYFGSAKAASESAIEINSWKYLIGCPLNNFAFF